jgi:amino acid transporter
MLGDLPSTSKVGHAMGKAKELPHWLGVVRKRFYSPHHALLVLTIIGLALVTLFPLRLLMPVASAYTLVWYAATNFAALKLRPEKRFLVAVAPRRRPGSGSSGSGSTARSWAQASSDAQPRRQ